MSRSIVLSVSMMLSFLAAGCTSSSEPFKEWGAAQKYEDYVPPNSQIVAEGAGQLTFTPSTQGTLYLLDLDDMRKVKDLMTPHVVIAAAPQPGPDPIVFDPNTAKFTRKGRNPLKLTKVIPGHRHQLRWQPLKTS